MKNRFTNAKPSRRRLSSLAVFAFATLMAACGGGGGGGGSDPDAGPSEADAVPQSATASMKEFVEFFSSLKNDDTRAPQAISPDAAQSAEEDVAAWPVDG